MSRFSAPVTAAVMAWHGRRHWAPLDHAAARPADAQRATLRRLLDANRDTVFGHRHAFGRIATLADFGRAVPAQDYEDLRPLVESQRTTGEQTLTTEPPLFYAQTSGTTGTPKYLPVTRTALDQHRSEQRLFAYLQYRACPAAYGGAAFGIMGAAVEDRLDSGHEVGSISGRLYASLPSLLRRRLVVPSAVADIADYDTRYRVLLMLALARPDVTYAGSPNPSTFLRLLDVFEAHRRELLDTLASGRSDAVAALPDHIRAAVEPRLAPSPDRAKTLAHQSRVDLGDVWPHLQLLTTWTGGSCGTALGALRARLPRAARVMELGYQATEMRGTVPLALDEPSGLPPIHHHVFEFADPRAWYDGDQQTLPIEALQVGRQYTVLVTTTAGLYRYVMNDIVEVTGHYRATPLMRFVQKGRGVVNITGEKLYEAQVVRAVGAACAAAGTVPRFYVLAGRDAPAGYRLFLEPAGAHVDGATLASEVDRRLEALNIEYASKRRSGRLAPPAVVPLRPGAGEAYRAACIRAGQRDGQLKPPVLALESSLLLDLESERAS